MTQPRRGLGRGLEALMVVLPASPGRDRRRDPGGDASGHRRASEPADRRQAASEPAPAPSARRSGPEMLDIDLISPNPEQPRTHFEPERLRELAESIGQHGIIQPLVVSRDTDGGYRLIAGERRLQAARLAGLQAVPVVVREVDEAELLELALIENIQRADLNPIEEAQAYRRLVEEYDLTQEEAARRVGKSRAAVANALRLLTLDAEIRRSLVEGEISEGHARTLPRAARQPVPHRSLARGAQEAPQRPRHRGLRPPQAQPRIRPMAHRPRRRPCSAATPSSPTSKSASSARSAPA
ncbi:MAG: ParB/RepB/Spo0J family partition protein [Dehalococcoidia bacterium]|nr:ParB/RepB/Spo0J family partition protein [Dehalococcoidia bacterium]